MESYMNLGPHFSNIECQKQFKITNCGRRIQQLVWSTDGFPLVKPRRDPLYDSRDVRFKVNIVKILVICIRQTNSFLT